MPLYHRHHHCGPAAFHLSGAFGRHGFGPFGRGGPPGRGRGGPGGPEGLRFGRFLRDGDLRLVALALIEDGPRHGYDLIKALEERSGGFYSPSPGVVYPTLTYLEEAGYAASAADGNKKVYSITDAGRAYLAENRDQVASILQTMADIGERMTRARDWFERPGGRGHEHADDDAAEASGARGDLERARRRLRALIIAATEGTEDDQKRVAEILDRASDTILGRGPAA
ncbi:MAG: PadR family transcriptional regulator [Bauldia sp.]|nr:PadR family transcriptional regulator [Bauldia sp.]